MKFYLFLFAFAIAWTPYTFANTCEFESSPKVIEKGSSHLLQYWEFGDASVLSSLVLVDSELLKNYRSQVAGKIDVDAETLLLRYASAGGSADDSYNLHIILKSVYQYIRPIYCLESLLLENQIKRNSQMLISPTEFFAVYLTNRAGRLRVYYDTDDLNGLRNLSSLFTLIGSDIANGWAVVGNLHNHSFFMNNLGIDEAHHPQGVLAPSATDIGMFQSMRNSLNLQSASITNGFDTVIIQADQFDEFRNSNGPR